MSNVKQFGTVFVNLESVPFSKESFYAKYQGRVPDIKTAWKEVRESQIVLGITSKKETEESKPVQVQEEIQEIEPKLEVKKKRKKRRNND